MLGTSSLRDVYIVTLAALLAGCVSPEQSRQQAAQEAARRDQMQQAQLERVRDQCRQYGFVPQSNEFAKCVQDGATRAQDAASSRQQAAQLVLQCQQAMIQRGRGLGAGIANAAQCENDPYAHLRQPNGPAGPARESCQFTGSRVDGQNRICFYQCASGSAATTIGASNICELVFQK